MPAWAGTPPFHRYADPIDAIATLTQPWSLPIAVTLPVVLMCGAGAVIVTAAALSGRAARRPDMAAQRWSRPLPAVLGRVIAARSTRTVLPVLGLIAAAAGCGVLVAHAAPADGLVLLAALTWVALLVGPVYRVVNPVRALAPAPPSVVAERAGPPAGPALADTPVPVEPAQPARETSDLPAGPAHTTPDLPAGPAHTTSESPAQPAREASDLHGHRHDHGHDHQRAAATTAAAEASAYATAHAGELRRASAWLLALCALLLTTRDPRVLAATAAIHVAVQAARARWRRGALDPLEVLSDLVACIAPVGRDLGGRLAWRNPLVAVAHATLPRGAITLGAVVIAASMANALTGPRTAARPASLPAGMPDDVTPLVALAASFVIVMVVLRLGVIRPFFASATIPLLAAYGIVAAGRWWPPVDLVAFVALHNVAIAVLHRQAIARHDLRTARAVQFPMRVVVLASVLTGLTLLWAW